MTGRPFMMAITHDCSQALCISLSSGFTTYPSRFEPVWTYLDQVTVWNPIPPNGYVALGCIAHPHTSSGRMTQQRIVATVSLDF